MQNRRRKIIFLTALVILALAITGAVAYASSLPKAPDSETILEAHDNQVVVLVHGMGRTEWSMAPLEYTLERQGYTVVNWGYSSTCCSVDELSDQLAAGLTDVTDSNPDQIHFVGHSLGNIVIRAMLEKSPPTQSGRVVMLAPPNGGSESADRYADYFGWLLEPLEDLTTADDSTVKNLSHIEDRDLGIIAGEYDGKVSIEETRQPGAVDHAIVPSTHTFIMNRADVHHLVVGFLEFGEF